MATLKEIVAYFLANYPHKSELSKARLTKMVYLADWKFAIDHHKQITDIQWKFNHFGPYVDDVHRVALEDPDFKVVSEVNPYGNLKERIALKGSPKPVELPQNVKATLDHVIEQTKPLNWDSFIKLVYSTYPVLSGERGARLDLIKAADEYRELDELIGRSQVR